MQHPQQHTYVVIMAGGVGSRFWPESRTHLPKQFLDILGVGKSLIRLTFERFLDLVPASNIFIVTNKQYEGLVLEHLPELTANQVVCEPSRNNTAPCVAFAAMKLQHKDPKANMIVAPSDHIILQPQRFLELVKEGLAYTAIQDAIVTLGIEPTRPDTGYGYIHFGQQIQGQVHKVRQFKEKPNLATAQTFLDSGEYLWNAGIFLFRASVAIQEFQQHAPDVLSALSPCELDFNTEREQAAMDMYYPNTPSISIDYAIMERSQQVFTIPSSFGWSDLGTWASLYVESDKDAYNNVLQGNISTEDVEDSLIRVPEGKKAVVRGLKDFIIVDTADALMIYPKGKEQEVKKITTSLKDTVWE